jgi:DNA mismatch endonuclease, patch repair protein
VEVCVDVLTPKQRSYNMSRVRGRDTRPEILLRRALHASGLRYRLHMASLPGRPDIVLPRHRCVVQVHGCFWHGHDCPMYRLPATRPEFWSAKIEANRQRDLRTSAALQSSGWRVLTVWECALRGPARRSIDAVVSDARTFILSGTATLTVSGAWTPRALPIG